MCFYTSDIYSYVHSVLKITILSFRHIDFLFTLKRATFSTTYPFAEGEIKILLKRQIYVSNSLWLLVAAMSSRATLFVFDFVDSNSRLVDTIIETATGGNFITDNLIIITFHLFLMFNFLQRLGHRFE